MYSTNGMPLDRYTRDQGSYKFISYNEGYDVNMKHCFLIVPISYYSRNAKEFLFTIMYVVSCCNHIIFAYRYNIFIVIAV